MALAVIAYGVGTFPSAQLVARAKGLDITAVGSGNPGASNVARSLGWTSGVWVFALDAAKGGLAAGMGYWAGGRPGAYALGALAVLGHIYPVTRSWRGGKGVATGAGVVSVLNPLIAVAVISLWWILSRLTGKAAIGSIIAVAMVPIGMTLTASPGWEYAAVLGICGLIIARHRSNIVRLVRRQEHALSTDIGR